MRSLVIVALLIGFGGLSFYRSSQMIENSNTLIEYEGDYVAWFNEMPPASGDGYVRITDDEVAVIDAVFRIGYQRFSADLRDDGVVLVPFEESLISPNVNGASGGVDLYAVLETTDGDRRTVVIYDVRFGVAH